ncbi:MAG: metal-dependent hydrolase [Candidatus Brennerbacteria bacterium]|nr:metal-dependent hydrolase [Candidatus Brennerbacteria bacterium]
MDIFSHGIWTALAAKGLNRKIKKPLNVWLSLFWGIFPDLFAFTIPTLGLVYNLIFQGLNLTDLPGPDKIEPPPQDTLWVFNLATTLYNYSHSIIIFVLIFALVYFIFKKPRWEMLAWLGHIFIDIPTHSYRFYPTPFLWPISELKFDGFSWGEPWFIALNYSAILLVYLLLRLRGKK